jgi:N-acyl-D-amino-acid deacylase
VIVFRGADVYPGDGPAFRADVGIADGRIAAIGEGLDGEVVAADGAMLCPGFIDMHAHSALAPFDDPLLSPKILQGFTTEVICPDGLAPAPVRDWRARQAYLRALEGPGPEEWPWSTFAEYLDALPPTAMTLVPSVGHGSVREFCDGRIDAMRHEVRVAFEAGARMLSFGLVYMPGALADTEELVAVAEIAAEFGAPLVPHVRNEGHGVLEAVREMIEVSERSGAPLHLSHLKCLADEALLEPLLELVESAGATFDQYPYGAGSTLLAGRRREARRQRSRARPNRARVGGSRTTSRTAFPGGRTSSARSARNGSSSTASRSPTAAAIPSTRCASCCWRASSRRR